MNFLSQMMTNKDKDLYNNNIRKNYIFQILWKILNQQAKKTNIILILNKNQENE